MHLNVLYHLYGNNIIGIELGVYYNYTTRVIFCSVPARSYGSPGARLREGQARTKRHIDTVYNNNDDTQFG